MAVALLSPLAAHAMGLQVEPAGGACPALQATPNTPPPQAARRLQDSQVARGERNIAWAWLGSPTQRYPHKGLGSTTHAGSLHLMVHSGKGVHSGPAAPGLREVVLALPLNRVFEDRVPRVVDLDGDGKDEVLLIESDALKGSALVVFGVRAAKSGALEIHEIARSPHTGSTFRWLNPAGVADFDGDGKLDIASVVTPHIGGVLTLYHYRPPLLVPFATAMDVSNHKMGELEQSLAAIVTLPGLRPAIIVPDMTLSALHAFRWEAPGQWKELADVKPLPARIERIEALAGQGLPAGACVKLTDGAWVRVWLTQ